MRSKDSESQLRLPEILGVPKRGIIFSDLDGVWFDEERNFAPPDPTDVAILQKARNLGYWLVLNSDTAADTLASFAGTLGFDPLVIAENGAIISLPKRRIKEYLSPHKPFFYHYRINVLIKLAEENPNEAIYMGDATPLIQAGTRIVGSNCRAYLINSARECSLGVYTRMIGADGQLLINDAETQRTEALLNELLHKAPERAVLTCRRYPNLGSCLVKDLNQTKWQAVHWIINQFPGNLSYYMLGDSIYDSMEPLANQVVTCAVGNASEELKAVALRTGGILAPQQALVAKGADFIIKQILEQSL